MRYFRGHALRRVVTLLGVLLLTGCTARALGSAGSVAPAQGQPSATAPATAPATLQVFTPAGAATAAPVAPTADALPWRASAATPAAPPATAPASAPAAQVVFTSRRTGQPQLYVMPVPPPGAHPGSDQANPRPLTQGQDWSGSPVVAPEGRRAAYVVETRRADGSPHDREIYLVDIQGGKPANLTSNPALDFDPAWSPDGKQIAFVSNRDGEATSHGIYVMDVAEAVQGRGDGNARRIVEDGQAPAWSPDGRRIAFISDREKAGQFQAYMVNGEGSGLRRLTEQARSGSGAGVGRPAWSPDGTRLALPADWDGNREIYLLSVAGDQPEPINVTNDPGFDDYPAWSPDGKQIAFISNRSGSPRLYLMDAGGGNVIALAPGLDASQPSWSSDGTRLAFVVSGPGPDFDQDVYVVNRDSAGLADLSRNPSQDTFPAWAQTR